MSAYNVVRFRVKPGCEEQFVAAHRDFQHALSGFRGGALVKTGDRDFCLVGEWSSFDKIVAARPKMLGILDGFRDLLEDLGEGVTDPVSGETILKLKPAKTKKGKKGKKAEKKDKKSEKAKAKETAAKKAREKDAKPAKAKSSKLPRAASKIQKPKKK